MRPSLLRYHAPVPPPASQDLVEVEWQFAAPETGAAVEWLDVAAVPGYTVTPGQVKEFEDTYFDTADWRLYRAGFTCRVRNRGTASEVTLKTMAEAQEGIRSRREITEQLDGAPPADLTRLPGPCGEIVRAVAGKRPVRALFTLKQVRRVYHLSDEQGDLGEIAVDDTAILRDGGGTHPLVRIEVEVAAGAEQRARRFVDVLAVKAGLVPAGPAKFQAAMEVTGTVPSYPERTLGSTAITPAMTAAEVAFAVLRKHFAVFLANEPGTRLGHDIEALHDMRVATRRMRAAMQAFRPWLPPRFERFREELGWVAAALGTVRDLDVQIERMEEWRHGFPEERAHVLDAVEAILEERRTRARTRMLAALDSRRYDRFVERFAVALRAGASRRFEPGNTPILAIAPDLVRKRYRRVRKRGDAITPSSAPADYHALRIDAKKLRYAVEFVTPIYGKPATEFATRLTALQDLLGLHQDAEVAETMLHDLAMQAGRRLGADTLLAMGAISERYRQHAIELRAGFPPVYKGIKGKAWDDLRKQLRALQPKG
jgi:CHAD domain-containing protein